MNKQKNEKVILTDEENRVSNEEEASTMLEHRIRLMSAQEAGGGAGRKCDYDL